MSPTTEQFLALFEPKGVVIAGASTHPGQVRVRRASTTCWPPGTAATCSPPTSRAARCWASRRCGRIDELPEGQADLDLRVHPQGRQPRPAAYRAPPRASGPRSSPPPGTARRGSEGTPGRGRARRAVRGARHPPRRAERPGRRVDAVAPVRADRGAVPAGRAHRRGQPVGQLRVVLHELVLRHRHRHQPGGVGRQRRGHQRRRLPRATTPTTRRRRSGSPTSRASPTVAAFFEHARATWPRTMPLVVVKGGATAGGARAAASHTGSLATDDRVFDGACRQAGRDPRGDGRGGVRGRRDLRHPATAHAATGSSS